MDSTTDNAVSGYSSIVSSITSATISMSNAITNGMIINTVDT